MAALDAASSGPAEAATDEVAPIVEDEEVAKWERIAEVEDDDSGAENEYDIMESSLCGEYSSGGGGGGGGGAGGIGMSQRTQNGIVKAQKAAIKVANYQGRDDRATSEQVMDPRTRLILFKLLSRGVFECIDGCLSTGKEANVYYARGGPQAAALAEAAGDSPAGAAAVADLAVKIYKTSILVFKDRQRYVDGEHRFRNGYSKGKNPRKMVQLWAEKELRNYKRLVACGVRAPRPVLLKGNVLVMEFIGNDGWPAPRLRDAALNERRVREAYWQTCRAMRVMYKRCRLVHGDLSEYNLLWHDKEVVVIDVSQSVEHDHPRASEFLRKDCANVNDFFGKAVQHPIEPLSLRELFDFVTGDGAPFATIRAAKGCEIPNFKGSYLGRFPLVSADFWTSDHLSERPRSMDVFPVTRARGTLTLKRR